MRACHRLIGVDMITACDIRVCSQDAFFSVREVDLALAADLGTLQRLPKVIGTARYIATIVHDMIATLHLMMYH